MPATNTVQIIPFRDDLAADFDRLNRAWLLAGNFLEPADEVYLVAPRATIVDRGGEVFFAIESGVVIGTAAAVPLGSGDFELAKVCVTPEAMGRGIGRRLTTAAIEFARAQGASTMILSSSTRLGPALELYRSLGFEPVPCPPGFGYATADVYLALALRPAGALGIENRG